MVAPKLTGFERLGGATCGPKGQAECLPQIFLALLLKGTNHGEGEE